ncbi:MAG: SDR family NAD(P)-dependent oxidoreductase [Nitrospirae bacterium]|nr:SDR family NAD(P)-dependent oxidoreductase [Candidatus Manganitrophaceae bacterium]
MSHLKGQVALITGGSSGIGYAIAAALVAEGMAVGLSARHPKELQEAAARLEKEGGTVFALPTDVSQQDQVARFVAEGVRRHGRIDLLVNNAGIGKSGRIESFSEADWDQIQAVNLKGAFLCTQAVLPVMKRQRSGYIVNLSSLAGKQGAGGMAAYSASKFGLIGFTESLLEEAIEYHIRATAICPGYVATPMVAGVSVPPEEMIPPEDIGKLVVGLLHLSPVTVIKEIVVRRRGAID